MIRPNQKPSDQEIISYGSGESQVRLEFAIGENKYRVVREVHKTRPNTAKLHEVKPGGALKTIATTVKDTTAEIERLLGGITYNEIVASSVVAQKDLERLIRQRLDDRRKVINVFLNLESFNKVQDVLGEEKTRLEGTSRNPGRLTVEKQGLETLTERMKEYKEREDQLSTIGEKTEGLRQELKSLEKTFQETDELYRTLNQYDEALDRQEALKKELEGKDQLEQSLNKQIANLSSVRTELEQVTAQLSSYAGLDDDEMLLAESSKQLETVRESELRLNQLQEQQQRLQGNIADKRRDLPHSKPKAAVTKSSARDWAFLATTGAFGAVAILSISLNFFVPLVPVVSGSLAVVSLILVARQFSSLSRVAEASEEQQSARAGYELLQSWESNVAEIERNISGLRDKVVSESKSILQSLRSISRYSNKLKEIDSAREAVEKAEILFDHDKQSRNVLAERVRLLERQLQEEPEIRKKLQETREEAKLVDGGLAEVHLPNLPEGVEYSENVLAEAGRYRDSLNESVSRVRTQIEETTTRQLEIKNFLEENRDLAEKMDNQQRKVRLIEKDVAVVKYAIKGLEQTSESLRNRVKPQVERYMGLILPVITSGRYKAVQLEDDYTVRVFDPEAGEFKPKEVFSGGTEDQLLLAMRLAFALALIPQAKGQSPEFLFLDEPLGSSDRVRREGILALLQKELSQNFKQIFLISHVGDLEEEADTVIQMENGVVREVIGRKPSLPQPVEIHA